MDTLRRFLNLSWMSAGAAAEPAARPDEFPDPREGQFLGHQSALREMMRREQESDLSAIENEACRLLMYFPHPAAALTTALEAVSHVNKFSVQRAVNLASRMEGYVPQGPMHFHAASQLAAQIRDIGHKAEKLDDRLYATSVLEQMGNALCAQEQLRHP